MSTAQLDTVVRRLRGLIDGPAEATDRRLLEEFAERRDEAAFAELVRRHGPLVLGVCRRALRHQQDAEDAFQATFLVLARSAGSIRNRAVLSSWLHGVSRRIAMKAKREAARRRAREDRARPATTSNPPGDLAWREVQAILDEGIERLPAHYRAPFLLCCLQGKGRLEAAAELGLKEGTLSSRLAKARRLLQEWLARRGVSLAAVLGVCAIHDAHAISAPLAQGTIRAAALTVAGSGAAEVPARVLGWADAAAKGFGRAKAVGILVLALGLCAGGIGLVAQRSASAQPATPARTDTPAAEPAAPAKGGEFEVVGSVLNPDGKPAHGAEVFLWTKDLKKRADVQVRTTAGEDGSFRLLVPDFALKRDAKVIAAAKGFSPDWEDLHAPPKGEITLRLAKDDLPVSGRVIDLEGRPIAGATIEVTDVSKHASGNLQPYIDGWKNYRPMGPLVIPPMQSIPLAALDVPTKATTDKDGRYRFDGLGRERKIDVSFRAPGAERKTLTAMTRNDIDPEQQNVRLYGTKVDVSLGPAKVIEGRITELGTGKPLAGVRVHGGMSQATTDKDGRYRLEGVGKRSMYFVSVAPGRTHFSPQPRQVADTPDLEPVKVDIELDRGVEITGKLRDSDGKPVSGEVWYYAKADNPAVKNAGAPDGLNSRAGAGLDGTFRILVLPGPAYLAAHADRNVFTRATLKGWDGGPVDAVPHGLFPHNYHAIAEINPYPDKPETSRYTIELKPGLTKSGSVVGPDDVPVEGALAFGLTAIPDPGARISPRPERFGPPPPARLKGNQFTAVGLDPSEPRYLAFVHPEKKLGKLVRVRGDEQGDLVVKLEPLGTITGRVLIGGEPAAGLTVTPLPPRRFADYKDLPIDLLNASPGLFIADREARKWLPDLGVTDGKGVFRMEGFLPGLTYQLMVGDGELRGGLMPTHVRNGIKVEPGRTTDLGDMRNDRKE